MFFVCILVALSSLPFMHALTASHLYQLQRATFASLKADSFKYHIVDPDDTGLTKDQVTQLKNQGKIILAYISVGAVENYRDFWQKNWREGNPVWLDKEILPDWPGNFHVKYWMPELQGIIINFMRNHILAKGYSGIYLDGVDTYYFYEEQGRQTAAQEMIQYIGQLRQAAQAVQPGTLVFPQNGVELYQYANYRPLVDGFGIEDTWTDGDSKQDQYNTNEVLKYMRMAKKDGKTILSVDYPKKSANVCSYYQKCFAEGWSCAVNDRDLTGIIRSC
ncbi:hypothetical protein BV898_06243 [Hypsibius exemplaris]|uniref:Glycoside-hydrolase family GH114 TIM-barrel domain-containing protein n=1 Tax=Hypsibius exemplaris TaxID=2072580 RepID=A0A1W0WX02_HYPEX|nr:hypothetical protein BV898_06243 [Hypsibius exemplaris]